MTDRERLVALGEIPCETVLKNGTYLNVFTNEWIRADIALEGEHIVGVGEYEGKVSIDCSGKYIVPGFIDAHMHIESSMIAPGELSKILAKAGTTAIVADPHEAVNVAGVEAFEWMYSATEGLPVSVYLMMPSSVPATDEETNGAGEILARDMERFLSYDRVLGLAEVMRFFDVINGDSRMMEKLRLFKDMHIDGHIPGVSGKNLVAYRLSGVENDHECSSVDEAIEKLRLGFDIFIRQGSGAKNLDVLIPGLLERGIDLTHCMFCTDDKHTQQIKSEGHISTCIRLAMGYGVDSATAYKMGSFHTAQRYGLRDLGALAPGYIGDILILNDIEKVDIEKVIKRGIVLEEEDFKKDYSIKIPSELKHSVKLPDINIDDIRLELEPEMNCIQMISGELLTRRVIDSNLKCDDIDGKKYFKADGENNKLLVIERHGHGKQIGKAVIKGFGIKNGAIATTVAHDSHNLILACDNDADALVAIREIEKMEGGYVIVSDGKIVGSLPLPICGLMSDKSCEEVEDNLEKMLETAYGLGITKGVDPFINLSFLALTVIPEIRLTESGIVILA